MCTVKSQQSKIRISYMAYAGVLVTCTYVYTVHKVALLHMSVTILYQYPCTCSSVSLLLYPSPLQYHCTSTTLSAAHKFNSYYTHKGCFSKLAVHHGVWVHAGHCCLTVKCITFPLLSMNESHAHMYQLYRVITHVLNIISHCWWTHLANELR